MVYDAKTGDDITRGVLTQIIVEEESKGQNLLPIDFLRHLISFYGDSLQSLVPRYLDYSMNSFARNQEQMRHYLNDALGGTNPFSQFEEMGKQNMAMFENAMKMFTPFYGADAPRPGAPPPDSPRPEPKDAAPAKGAPDSAPESAHAGSDAGLDDLRAKLDRMQQQLDNLADPDRRS